MAIARLRFCLAFSILETWELPAVTVAGTLVNNAHLVQPGSTLASMAASDSAGDDNIFELLKQADPSELEQRQRAINERIHATFQLSQQRLAELIDQNSTLPTTVSSVTVLGAPNTRHGFLKRKPRSPLHAIGAHTRGCKDCGQAQEIRYEHSQARRVFQADLLL